MPLVHISKAKLVVTSCLFVNARSLQTALEKIPAFPSLAPCMPRITSPCTASCPCSGCFPGRVRLSNHACRLFEGLVVTGRSNAKARLHAPGGIFCGPVKYVFLPDVPFSQARSHIIIIIQLYYI